MNYYKIWQLTKRILSYLWQILVYDHEVSLVLPLMRPSKLRAFMWTVEDGPMIFYSCWLDLLTCTPTYHCGVWIFVQLGCTPSSFYLKKKNILFKQLFLKEFLGQPNLLKNMKIVIKIKAIMRVKMQYKYKKESCFKICHKMIV